MSERVTWLAQQLRHVVALVTEAAAMPVTRGVPKIDIRRTDADGAVMEVDYVARDSDGDDSGDDSGGGGLVVELTLHNVYIPERVAVIPAPALDLADGSGIDAAASALLSGPKAHVVSVLQALGAGAGWARGRDKDLPHPHPVLPAPAPRQARLALLDPSASASGMGLAHAMPQVRGVRTLRLIDANMVWSTADPARLAPRWGLVLGEFLACFPDLRALHLIDTRGTAAITSTYGRHLDLRAVLGPSARPQLRVLELAGALFFHADGVPPMPPMPGLVSLCVPWDASTPDRARLRARAPSLRVLRTLDDDGEDDDIVHKTMRLVVRKGGIAVPPLETDAVRLDAIAVVDDEGVVLDEAEDASSMPGSLVTLSTCASSSLAISA